MHADEAVARPHPSHAVDTPAGRGLVAARDLEAGTVVEIFAGPVAVYGEIPEDEICYAVLFGDEWVLPRTNARYLNHSCQPNCFVSDTREVLTLRAVSAGEELTISYNSVTMAELLATPAPDYFWDPRWTFTCRCGGAHCVGLVDRYLVTPAEDDNSRNVTLGLSRGKGRGVFARRLIAAGEIFETAPVIVIPKEQWHDLEKTTFFDYTFEWGPEGEDAALALGQGSLYNHSYSPNARYTKRIDDLAIDFSALRQIEPGQEIFVNYNGDPNDRAPLWFPVDD